MKRIQTINISSLLIVIGLVLTILTPIVYFFSNLLLANNCKISEYENQCSFENGLSNVYGLALIVGGWLLVALIILAIGVANKLNVRSLKK